MSLDMDVCRHVCMYSQKTLTLGDAQYLRDVLIDNRFVRFSSQVQN